MVAGVNDLPMRWFLMQGTCPPYPGMAPTVLSLAGISVPFNNLPVPNTVRDQEEQRREEAKRRGEDLPGPLRFLCSSSFVLLSTQRLEAVNSICMNFQNLFGFLILEK
jgi:hypothetical protein